MKSHFFCSMVIYSFTVLLVLEGVVAAAQPLGPSVTEPLVIDQKSGSYKAWLKALHMDPRQVTVRSRVDDLEFFLSKNGKNDPLGELKESIRWLQDERLSREFSCRFPFRTKVIQRIAPGIKTNPRCSALVHWHQSLSAKTVSILFASQYAGNPASRFGHTFLKIHQQEGAESLAMSPLDPVVSFAARIGEVSTFRYIYDGLFGGFKGKFSVSPFTNILREYSGWEDRNLWEYRLDIPRDRVEDLVDHLWEVTQTWWDYWFITENCSYQLLAILEAVMPETELVDQFFWAVEPIETIKVLKQKGLVTGLAMHPSVGRRFHRTLATLDPSQRQQLQQLTQSHDVTTTDDADVLETVMLWIDYIHSNNQSRDRRLEVLRAEVLDKRASFPSAQYRSFRTYHKSEEPHRVLPLSLSEVGILRSDDSDSGYLRFRPLLRDIMNHNRGISGEEELSFFDSTLGWSSDSLDLIQMTFFRNIVFNPLSLGERDLSRDIVVTYDNISLRREYLGDLRFGLTRSLAPRLLLWGLGSVGVSAREVDSYEPNPIAGLHGGILIPGDVTKLFIAYRYWSDVRLEKFYRRLWDMRLAFYLSDTAQLNLSYRYDVSVTDRSLSMTVGSALAL